MESLSLSLRTWPEKDQKAKSLPSLIPRISQQRGHLRNVTEETLLQEIEAGESGDADVLDSSDNDESRDKDEPKDILASREEIIAQVGQAYNEAYRALDFVSLVLSKDTPRQAEISISPYVKQHAPLGSIGVDKVLKPPLPQHKRQDQERVSRGWKLQGLQSAADALLRSADRLEKEIKLETQYWEQVLAVSGKGWSVCQLPREKHTLAVRFGFPEATGTFRDRGLAALRRNEDGKIILDQGIATSTPKSLRVRVERRDGTLVSSSAVPPLKDADAIEDVILQARNSIYEEEIYYEMGREARLLANQGVQLVESTITLALPEQRIVIDLVPLDNEELQLLTAAESRIADGIASAFRILLSYAHRQNLHRRSQPPPPLTERPRPNPPYLLLRPVLTHLSHESALASVRELLKPLIAPLRAAGLLSSFQFRITDGLNLPTSDRATVEKVVEAFIERTETILDLTLPGSFSVRVKIRTHLRPPTFGTEFLVSTRVMTGDARPPADASFTSVAELNRYLQHLATLAIVAEVVGYSNSPPSAEEPIPVDGKKSTTGPEKLRAGTLGWQRTAQFDELEKSDLEGFTGRNARMTFYVSEEGMGLRAGWKNWREGQNAPTQHSWSGDPGVEGERKTLRAVVAAIGLSPSTSSSKSTK